MAYISHFNHKTLQESLFAGSLFGKKTILANNNSQEWMRAIRKPSQSNPTTDNCYIVYRLIAAPP